MYKVIGVDGKEYGPISLDQLKQWIAQGRVNAQTRIQDAGTANWKTAADFPELTAVLAPVVPAQPAAAAAASNMPEGKQGLALASLILGILAFPTCFLTGIPAIICGHIAYSRGRSAPAQYGRSGMALAGMILGYVSLAIIPFLIMPAMLLPALSRAKERAQRIACVNNMKQIGIGFRVWALDHNDQYPFNLSTNVGGTLELCAPGADGFDQNAYLHFMVLSNELGNAGLLVCPADNTKQRALDFLQLQAGNVTYQLRAGTNAAATPGAALAVCPIHHNVLLYDGSVQQPPRARRSGPY